MPAAAPATSSTRSAARPPSPDAIRSLVAELYTLGLAPDWRRLNGEASRATRLPTYQ